MGILEFGPMSARLTAPLKLLMSTAPHINQMFLPIEGELLSRVVYDNSGGLPGFLDPIDELHAADDLREVLIPV